MPTQIEPNENHPRSRTGDPPTQVVAVVHCPEDIEAAQTPPDGIDWLELRLDCLRRDLDAAARLARAAPRPILVTARDPSEGGQDADLGPDARAERYLRFLPDCRGIDIELARASEMTAVIGQARAGAREVILSHHDFEGTPDIGMLRGMARRAADAGATILKVAARLRAPRDLDALLTLVTDPTLPVAAMGMGPPLGKASRLLLAAAGSRLTYGYLSRPNAPGQWPARLLAQRVRECVE